MSKSEQNRPKNRASIDDSLLRLFERDERRGEKRRGEERGRRTNWPHGSIGSAACTILFGTRIETVSESDVSAAAMDVEERGVESHGRSRLAIVVLAREWLVLQ